ncbi:MAG TPA: 7-cyano-7-deazaguanine synthase [Tepidisphaeraceae bacterium]|nr:7-cyano-7-deazaguanine synthase [Tepidisphaeraceae bacterium]
MPKDLAIILNNGSINSAVVTALAAQKARPILLHAETSSPPSSRARAAYDQQVAFFKPFREHTLSLMTSPPGAESTTNADPRAETYDRRMLDLLPLIAAAAQYAVHYQAAAIYLGLRIGPHEEELARGTEYVQIWTEMLQSPCGQTDLEILTPLLELEPWQVVDLGFQAGVPFERTWTCQEEGSDPCWSCRTCQLREAAFQQAGKVDPLKGRK